MASLTTSAAKIGLNGYYTSVDGSHLSLSTATTSVTLTVGDANSVGIFAYNPTGDTAVTITLKSTHAATRHVSRGRGDLVIATMGSSDYTFIGNLESAWFKSTSNTIKLSISTAILVAAVEYTSTRLN